MQIKDLIVAPHEVRPGAEARPLAFVELEMADREAPPPALPAFPVIGLGAGDHPWAQAMDAVIEPPISAEAVVSQVLSAPKAASVAVQLLRSLEGVDIERALTLESLSYGLLQGSAEHHAWLAARGPAVDPMPSGSVRLERGGDVLRIVLDRPDAHNAIDRAMRDALYEAFTLADADRDIATIQLRSEGEAFCIGGDLDEFGTTRDPAVAHLIRMQTLPARALAPRAEILDVHVQGACVGAGVEIAAFAGRVTAAEPAWFQLPELAMGLIPGAGGCVSLPRRIGRQRAALMLLSGKRISAKTALAWGLVDAIGA